MSNPLRSRFTILADLIDINGLRNYELQNIYQ